jgi:hypothetical protein
MKITPRSEQQLVEEALVSRGEYAFEIVDGRDDISKNHNEMIVLVLQLYDKEGHGLRRVTDYLTAKKPLKLRHAAQACGLMSHYESGEITGDLFKGKCGKARIGIERDRSGRYAPKNHVLDYLP